MHRSAFCWKQGEVINQRWLAGRGAGQGSGISYHTGITRTRRPHNRPIVARQCDIAMLVGRVAGVGCRLLGCLLPEPGIPALVTKPHTAGRRLHYLHQVCYTGQAFQHQDTAGLLGKDFSLTESF